MQNKRRTAERSCVACREKNEQQHFLRYVLGPDNQLVVDYRNRLPGRGAYTCFTSECIGKALKNGGFTRAFRKEISALSNEDLLKTALDAINQRIFGLLGVARKAGEVISGTSQLQAAFGRQEIKYLIIAEDAADGSVGKITRQADQERVQWVRFSSQAMLGQIAGRENRNCIGIKNKQFADLLALETNRLQQIAGEN